MRSGRRVLVSALAVLVLLAVLFPAFFIACEADHDCTGDCCGVCLSIRQCEALLQSVSAALLIMCALLLAVRAALLAASALSVTVWQETPVSRKVRLNN